MSENAINIQDGSKFAPRDCKLDQPHINLLPYGHWLTLLESPCTFPPEVFSKVMLNLIKNPNITSSHLFRADILYDSDAHPTLSHDHENAEPASNAILQHLKPEYRPLNAVLPGFQLQRTFVRQLIPRNPQLDKPLVQTCHFFQNLDDNGKETNVVLYIPLVQRVEEMPFYHPAVSRLAFRHQWPPDSDASSGSMSLSFELFSDTELTTKLERTALKLLQTVHKHGQGQLAGYQKRVHLDQIIPQKRYQDTYARLKAKYGAKLSREWVEVTDPGKHVFEDIAIAAWLIELWRDLYDFDDGDQSESGETEKPKFPGFVDIGCGNGILVSILLCESYQGWGFDARERKTWTTFSDDVQQNLQQKLLVPQTLQERSSSTAHSNMWHNGVFEPHTFVISNHADELTAWTPLLAYLNGSEFVAIPCCSHDLGGARFRAPMKVKSGANGSAMSQRLPQQAPSEYSEKHSHQHETGASNLLDRQAAETGSLVRTTEQKKMPSAYSSLCSYVASLAEEVGFQPEADVLRIPSTRNSCIVGRRRQHDGEIETLEVKQNRLAAIIEKESGRSVGSVATEWIERAERLSKKPGSGH